MLGSGRPSLAATVISRASLENSLDRIASCLPLRCMMFLNCEWPAMALLDAVEAVGAAVARARPPRKTARPYTSRRRGNDKEDAARGWRSLPEVRPRLRQCGPDAHGRDGQRQAGAVVDVDGDARTACPGRWPARAAPRASSAGSGGPAPPWPCRGWNRSRRTCRRRTCRRCRPAGSAWSAVGTWVWVPTTSVARPSTKCAMACFSLVASACMSIEDGVAAAPSGQARSSRSTAANGIVQRVHEERGPSRS